ncbi:hypothetical protein MVLG_03378 [Microbotryum lychnidis-dioicae p1A1 Lamole]|uniref:Uncharacterized protein n=1 Tax=Microbotryum lychnidis-dioicae (strain p1A1 Lamole / MvSl-1064) TaxID=683840 RepID=U5H811_USTV1|nr:hypothetical protein MVLG_03378 [Microbotryum lychnidis-dioicae p1A1 Lamole]|eukprot:KDE06341.1 hypothetical protein MVLG_03378 [Microbotryum lychnidis-dioicae p1A1 Lamole]
MSFAPNLTHRPSVKRSRMHTTPAKPMTRSRTLSRLAKTSIGRISRFLNTGGGGGGGGGGTGTSAVGYTRSRSEPPLPPLPYAVKTAALGPSLYRAESFENVPLADHSISRKRTLKGSISYPVLRSATCASVYECDSEDSRRLGFSTPRSSPPVGYGLKAYRREGQENSGRSSMADDEEELVITVSSRKDARNPKTLKNGSPPSPAPPATPAKSVHWPPRKSSLATEYEYDPNECSSKTKVDPLPTPTSLKFSEKEQRRISVSAAMARAQQRHTTFHERDLETWTSFINDSFGSFDSSLALATFDTSVPVLTIVDFEDDRSGARSPDATNVGDFAPLTTGDGCATSSDPRPLSTTSSLFTSGLHSGQLSTMLDSTSTLTRPISFCLSPKGMGDFSTFPFDVATNTMDESWLFDENRFSFLSYPFRIEGELSRPGDQFEEDRDSVTSEWQGESGADEATEVGEGKKRQKTTISMMLQWCQRPPSEGYLVDREDVEGMDEQDGVGEHEEEHEEQEQEQEEVLEEDDDETLLDLDGLSDCFDVEIDFEVEMDPTICGARQSNRPVSLDAYPFRTMRGDDWSGLDRKIRNTM